MNENITYVINKYKNNKTHVLTESPIQPLEIVLGMLNSFFSLFIKLFDFISKSGRNHRKTVDDVIAASQDNIQQDLLKLVDQHKEKAKNLYSKRLGVKIVTDDPSSVQFKFIKMIARRISDNFDINGIVNIIAGIGRVFVMTTVLGFIQKKSCAWCQYVIR